MATATLQQRRMTEAEFMRLPDDGHKYELVDGEPKEVPTSFPHDLIAAVVHLAIAPFAKGIGYITLGQTGYRMVSGNIRCPDIGFTLKTRFPDGVLPQGFGDFAPDLCIEIISPSEERADMERKVREYFAAGASIVWQMFPEAQRIVVFTSPEIETVYASDDVIDAGTLLPGFRCLVADLFQIE